MIIDGKNDKAVEVIARATKSASYRIDTIIRTMQVGKNRATGIDKAVKSGAEKFKYVGASANIRPFCANNLNKIFTLEEIEKMDNGQGLSVKYFCGGYNCRHRWIVTQEGQAIKEQLDNLKNKEIRWDTKDLKSDTRKHLKGFGYTDEKQYENEAIEIVKKQINPYVNYHNGIEQFMFVADKGIVVCTKQGKIKGYYHSNDIERTKEYYLKVKKCVLI